MRQALQSRRNASKPSSSLILSYVVDWCVLLAAAAIGTWLATIPPNKRPFSLGNPDISFPHKDDTVSSQVLIIVSMLVPAVIIVFVCLILVPGPTVPKSVPKNLIWKRKLWEWFTGWLGLGMSCAGTWFITSGLKNLIGKPRPDLLDRCMPDVANFAKHVLTSFPITPDKMSLVGASICTQTNSGVLDDGWRSWPSGHSSFSAAGLIYLSLFLASKLAITIPFLSQHNGDAQSAIDYTTAFPSRSPRAPLSAYPTLPTFRGQSDLDHSKSSSGHSTKVAHNLNPRLISARNQAASPPIYLLAICFLPTAAAMYIAASRYCDFHHAGFDILSGSVIGAVNAFWAFRYYHLPIARGAGWSWGPRSRSRAWWAGIGVGSYVGDEEGDRKRRDEEAAMGEAVMMDDMMDPDSANRARDLSRSRDGAHDRETVGIPSGYTNDDDGRMRDEEMGGIGYAELYPGPGPLRSIHSSQGPRLEENRL